MRTSFHHQSEAQPPNGPLTAATSPDTPSPGPTTHSRATGDFPKPRKYAPFGGILRGARCLCVRVEAAKLLGLPHIPCIRAKHLSASERRLVRMALNRLSEKGNGTPMTRSASGSKNLEDLRWVGAASFAATTSAPPWPCSRRGRIPRGASRPERSHYRSVRVRMPVLSG
jgi:hypothetical protein